MTTIQLTERPLSHEEVRALEAARDAAAAAVPAALRLLRRIQDNKRKAERLPVYETRERRARRLLCDSAYHDLGMIILAATDTVAKAYSAHGGSAYDPNAVSKKAAQQHYDRILERAKIAHQAAKDAEQSAYDNTSYKRVALKYDRIGGLLIWQGEATDDPNQAAYVQNSQEIDATLENTDIGPAERAEINTRHAITVGMYDEQLCALFGIEY